MIMFYARSAAIHQRAVSMRFKESFMDKLAGVGRFFLAVATVARVAKQDLFLHCDVTEKAGSKLVVRREIDARWIRRRACEQRAESNVISGEILLDHVTMLDGGGHIQADTANARRWRVRTA